MYIYYRLRCMYGTAWKLERRAGLATIVALPSSGERTAKHRHVCVSRPIRIRLAAHPMYRKPTREVTLVNLLMLRFPNKFHSAAFRPLNARSNGTPRLHSKICSPRGSRRYTSPRSGRRTPRFVYCDDVPGAVPCFMQDR